MPNTEQAFSLEIEKDQSTQENYYRRLLSSAGWRDFDKKNPLGKDDVRIAIAFEHSGPFGKMLLVELLNGIGRFLGDTEEGPSDGSMHTLSGVEAGIAIAEKKTPVSEPYSPALYAPSYIDALRELEHTKGFRPQNFLLAGSFGSLTAHDARVVVGVINPDANLTVVDKVRGSLADTAKIGGAYTFVQGDVTKSVPLGQDVIFTNVLLPFLVKGVKDGQRVVTVEAFFQNCFNALNQNGALIMVEPIEGEIEEGIVSMLKAIGFQVRVKRAKRFKHRFFADRYFAGTNSTYLPEDTQMDTEAVIVAIKQ